MAAPEKEEPGMGWGWIAAIAAALAGVLGVVGYQAGWLDKVVTRKPEDVRKDDIKKATDVAIAAHYYHDYYNIFPQNIVSDDGKPLLSWRVAILPYLGDEGEKLHKQFKLDEAWNSEHNKKLLPQMPKVFALAGIAPKTGRTSVQGFEGGLGETVFVKGGGLTAKGFSPKDEIGRIGKNVRIRDIRDGTSNTALFVEAADTVEWTKPQDLPFSMTGAMPKLAGTPGQKAIIALTDGSAKLLSNTITDEQLRGLATINGREITPPPFSDGAKLPSGMDHVNDPSAHLTPAPPYMAAAQPPLPHSLRR